MPADSSTPPVTIEELTFTLNAEAKAALLTPAVALELPVGAGVFDDELPVGSNVTLEAVHVTPPGLVGVKTTATVFVAVVPSMKSASYDKVTPVNVAPAIEKAGHETAVGPPTPDAKFTGFGVQKADGVVFA